MFVVFVIHYHRCSVFFFFSSRRRHTRCLSDWSSDVCSSDLEPGHREASAAAARNAAADRLKSRAAGDDTRSEERRVGKGVDLGGRRIIKKKKENKEKEEERLTYEDAVSKVQ